MLIILYPIDFRIIFSKFLLQPDPPKCSFLATPVKVSAHVQTGQPLISDPFSPPSSDFQCLYLAAFIPKPTNKEYINPSINPLTIKKKKN